MTSSDSEERRRKNAERQAGYRARKRRDGENGHERLSAWLSTRASLALKRLARHRGVTQEAVLEALLIQADDEVLKGLSLDSPEWTVYFSGSIPGNKPPTHGSARLIERSSDDPENAGPSVGPNSPGF